MPTIRELPAVDAAADTTTAYTLPYFIERFEGVLHDRDDEDRLAIHLTAGEAVTLTLAGHGDTPTPDTIGRHHPRPVRRGRQPPGPQRRHRL